MTQSPQVFGEIQLRPLSVTLLLLAVFNKTTVWLRNCWFRTRVISGLIHSQVVNCSEKSWQKLFWIQTTIQDCLGFKNGWETEWSGPELKLSNYATNINKGSQLYWLNTVNTHKRRPKSKILMYLLLWGEVHSNVPVEWAASIVVSSTCEDAWNTVGETPVHSSVGRAIDETRTRFSSEKQITRT